MRVLSETEDLQLLLDRLVQNGRLPYNLTVSSLLVATLSGRRDVEAVVDNWPDFEALVLRDSTECQQDGLLIPEVVCYTPGFNMESLEKLLTTGGVVAWDTSFAYSHLPVEHLDLIKRLVSKHGGKLEDANAGPLCPYRYDVTDADTDLSPADGYVLGQLGPQHADVILDTWHYKETYGCQRESYLSSIRSNILHLPNAAIFTAQDGQLASWMMTYPDLSMGMGHTLPPYRGKGLYGLVIRQLARKHLELFPRLLAPHVWIVQDNTAAHSVTVKNNFLQWKEQFWYFIYTPR